MRFRSSLDLSQLTINRGEQSLATVVLTFLIGAAGGFIAMALNAPLPMLLGSVIAIAAVSLARMKLFGRDPEVPLQLRLGFIPIIGLAIGGSFTPEVIAGAKQWWPSLVALVVFIPMVHWAGYYGYRWMGGLSPATAYYAAVPGGLIDAIQLGEEAGADPQMLTALQFLRLLLCIMLVPLGFTLVFGAVGSSAGAVLERGAIASSLEDVVILVVVGALGLWMGRRFKLPAGVITGPIILSAAVHLAGVTDAVPPIWLIQVTQLVMGVTLGTRFVGLPWGAFLTALKLSLANIVMTLALAFAAAVLLTPVVDEHPEVVVLAFAPGGLAEMALIAVSLQLSVVYVTAHHVFRLLLAIGFAKLFGRNIPRDVPATPAER